MKLGPISKVMGMIPGMGQMMSAMGAAGIGDDEVRALRACARAFFVVCVISPRARRRDGRVGFPFRPSIHPSVRPTRPTTHPHTHPTETKPQTRQTTLRFKRLLYIMDSMTDEELDGKVEMMSEKDKSESRIMRVARGSGAHPEEVGGSWGLLSPLLG